MSTMFPEDREGYTEYTLNILGIRVWKDRCQLIGRNGNKWLPLGMSKPLPLSASDEILPTARRIKAEHPDSDILEVLMAKPGTGERRAYAAASSEQSPAMAE